MSRTSAPRAKRAPTAAGRIWVGIGGWTYAPWRQTFYPVGTPHTRELEYASRHVTSIEINGTFYGLQKPTVFARWRDATPQDFVFAVKAPRFIVQQKQLANTGPSIERFMNSGLVELGDKLGPILWQLPPTKRFDGDDLDRFLGALPAKLGRLRLRHALEVRHESFFNRDTLAIARQHDVTLVYTDDPAYPRFADLTGACVYARLRCSRAAIATGYTPAELKGWKRRASAWAAGKHAPALPRIEPRVKIAGTPREVFIFFINGAKERAPAAAEALLATLS